jgi:hypothetical protein
MLDWLERPNRGDSPLRVIQGRKIVIGWKRHDLHIDDRAWPAPTQVTRVKATLDGQVSIWIPKLNTQ